MPQTGELWENENGPMGGDEINIITSGKNYGWKGNIFTEDCCCGT